MCIIVFLQGFVFYGPVATVYRTARGISMYEIFILESVFFVLMILFEIPWGYFADRFGYKKTLVFSNILFLVSKVVFYKAHSFILFFVEAILSALAISGLSGCDQALIISSINEEESEKVFGLYSAFGTLGFIGASLLSTIIIKKSIDYTAFFTIIPYGIAAIFTMFLKETAHEKEKHLCIIESIKRVISKKQMITFVFSISLIGVVTHSVSVFLNQPQYVKSGIQIKYFGILMAITQVISISSVKAYKFTQKIGKLKVLFILFIIIGFGTAVLAFTKNPVLTILIILIINGCAGIISPIAMDIENSSITTNDRATILSIYAMGSDILSSIINLIIGKAANVSVEMAFISSTILVCCACAILIFYTIKLKK